MLSYIVIMRATVRVLLAAACVAALLGQGLGQSYCTAISWGVASGTKVVLPTVALAPGIPDWKGTIPVKPPCSVVNGLRVDVCDNDSTPDANFLNDYIVYVHRNGNLMGQASLTATLYCS